MHSTNLDHKVDPQNWTNSNFCRASQKVFLDALGNYVGRLLDRITSKSWTNDRAKAKARYFRIGPLPQPENRRCIQLSV